MVRFRLRINLKAKILLYSTVIILLAFIVINYFWYVNTRNLTDANTSQYFAFAVEQASLRVDNYINTKLLGFLSHSQNAAVLSKDINLIREDLNHFLVQDPDVKTLSYVDENGMERLRVPSTSAPLRNYTEASEFVVPTFKFGKEYISPVFFTEEGIPRVTFSVPIQEPHDAESLRTFTSGSTEQKQQDEIHGVVIGIVDLTELLNSVSSIKIGKEGSMYIIDREGKIIAHPNRNFVGKQLAATSPQLQEKILTSFGAGYVHESIEFDNYTNTEGKEVHGFYHSTQKAPWIVIAEQPVSALLSQTEDIQRYATLLLVGPLLITVIVSLFFASRITNPLKQLVGGIAQISQGNFNQNLKVATGDELETLADEYSAMAENLKKAQESLKIQLDESESKKNTMQTVLSNVANGVIALDTSNQIIIFNAAAELMTGVPLANALGKNVSDIIQLKSQDEEISIEEHAAKFDTETTPLKCTFFSVNQERKVANVKIALVPPSQTNVIRYIITLEDITHEQELENMKLDFVSMAAHELRTPLTAIKGYLSVLSESINNKLSDEEKDSFVRVIVSADQLSAHIENLLNVTKIERGVFKIEYDYMSITDVIQKVIDSVQEVADQRNITIEFPSKTEQFPKIHADPYRIGEVVTNLVSNAINYTNPGGVISIWVELKSSEIITHIQDNGHGIPASSLPHLFTKFYRVGGPLVQGSRGTGLGLYICKSIIDQHNGRIWVESVEGQGSTFSFALPLISH